jgi:hypothetical protein
LGVLVTKRARLHSDPRTAEREGAFRASEKAGFKPRALKPGGSL